MALNSYLRLKGQTQGDIRGKVIQKGREGQILVTAWSHNIHIPRDSATGLPSGRRKHGILRITKPTEQSTPALYTALITNETVSAELLCWEPNRLGTMGGSGTEVQLYTIRLTNARIVEIQQVMPSNVHEETSKLPQYEEVSFLYDKIDWAYKTGNGAASDSWL